MAPILLWHTSMSLDGFIAGPGHAMDWVFRYDDPEPNPAIDQVIADTGALLVGRNSYEVGRQPDAPAEATEPFGGAWHGPQFVLTHDPPDDETDPDITFLSGDIAHAVAAARAAAGERMTLVFGADTARQCLEAGLLDEILIHVCPVLLGDGIRLFGDPAGPTVELEPIGAEPIGRVVNLRYSVPH